MTFSRQHAELVSHAHRPTSERCRRSCASNHERVDLLREASVRSDRNVAGFLPLPISFRFETHVDVPVSETSLNLVRQACASCSDAIVDESVREWWNEGIQPERKKLPLGMEPWDLPWNVGSSVLERINQRLRRSSSWTKEFSCILRNKRKGFGMVLGMIQCSCCFGFRRLVHASDSGEDDWYLLEGNVSFSLPRVPLQFSCLPTNHSSLEWIFFFAFDGRTRK